MPANRNCLPKCSSGRLYYCDHPDQAVVWGGLQRFGDDPTFIVAVGDVLLGKAEGRSSPKQITAFDSAGIALHELAMVRSLIAVKQAQSHL